MEFRDELLRKVAGALHVPYEQFAAETFPPPPALTVKILQLCASADRRKFKRGLRLYHQLNGPCAPHSFLFGHVNRLKMRIGQAAMQHAANRLYQEWLAANGLSPTPTPA